MNTTQLNNIEAERAVLGAIILEPGLSMGVVKERGVTPECFYDQRHGVIYRTLEALSASGKAVDVLTLMRRLEDKANVEKAGGRDYIVGMLDAIPTVSHLGHYIDEVLEKYRLRNLSRCVGTIGEMIDTGMSSAEIVSSVTASIVKNVDLGTPENPEQLHAESMSEFEKAQTGIHTGMTAFLEPLNEVLGAYVPGNLYVVAGRPSDGKSSFAFQEVIHQAVECKVPCAIASLEMSSKLLREMMAGSMADVSMYAMRNGQFSPAQLAKVRESFDTLKQSPVQINDKRMTIDEIVAWVTYAHSRYGVRLFALDYIQLIRPSRNARHNSRNEEVQEWSACIKDLTKRLGLVTIMLSQLSRAGVRLQDKTPPPPTLEALRDSGCIEQDADCVIMLYKKPCIDCSAFFADADWQMEASVEKHRIGPTGIRPYVFVRRRQRIESIMQYEHRQEREATGGAPA
jgi:replicative DNA helicase